jgi:hypothetical protein
VLCSHRTPGSWHRAARGSRAKPPARAGTGRAKRPTDRRNICVAIARLIHGPAHVTSLDRVREPVPPNHHPPRSEKGGLGLEADSACNVARWSDEIPSSPRSSCVRFETGFLFGRTSRHNRAVAVCRHQTGGVLAASVVRRVEGRTRRTQGQRRLDIRLTGRKINGQWLGGSWL